MKKSIFTISLSFFLMLSLFLIEIQPAYAQTDVPAGDVSGTWTQSNSPYNINGEITIPNGETLTIEPGVEVIFTGHYKLNVQGRLLAIGTKQDTITFTARKTQEGWHGIRFVDTPASNDSSKIIYCKLKYGKATGNDNNGGAMIVARYDKILVSNCLIKNNRTSGDLQSGGGGILIDSCSPQIVNNIISNNTVIGGHGGGIFIVNNSNPIIMNNIIFNNQAYGGGGIAFYSCNPTLINNTISNNNAIDHGGGIDCIYSSPTLMNTILYGNTAGIGKQVHFHTPNEPNFNFCDVEGGPNAFARNHSPGGSYNGDYSNNIDSDPLFVDKTNGDFHLQNTSHCIGAGADSVEVSGTWNFAPSEDIEGNPRPNPAGSNPDIGAFENELENPLTDIREEINQLPSKFMLSQNYPNPFNPGTTIEFFLPHSGFVTLKVYNIFGEEVSTLMSEKLSSGHYKYDWEAGGMASGLYFYKIDAGGYSSVKKALLLK